MASQESPPPSSAPAETKPRPLRRLSIGMHVSAQLAICVVLFLLANYLSYRHFWRQDLTPSQDYTLSEATIKFIKKLSKDV